MQQIDVKILDRDYKLAVDEADKGRLMDAARMVDEKMRSIREGGRISGTDRIAVMAALQLAHELLAGAGNVAAPVSGEMAKKIRKLSEHIDAEVRRQESLF